MKKPFCTCLTFVLIFFGLLIVLGIFFSSRGNKFPNDPVAIYKIEGGIFESLDTLKDLEEIRKNDDIKAVVLRIDSPGGAVASSQEIFEQVLKLKKDKKVIVSMGTVAASGGYYISCAADKIVASSGTITGSIGVIMESFGVQELLNQVKVESRTIKSGHFKDSGSPFRAMTEEEKEYFQNLSDNMYLQFLTAVSTNRKIPMDKMKTIAEGKVYSGEQAKELGLVDQLGNLYDAIDLAKKEAGLPEDADVSWPREPSAVEKFFGNDAKSFLGMLKNSLNLKVMPLWMLDNF